MVNRIATFTQTGVMARELMRLQTEYAKTSLQQSSSLKSETFQGISEDSYSLLKMQSNYDQLVSESENAQTALDRVDQMYSAVSSMNDLISSMSGALSEAISTANNETIQSTASDALDEFASLLNTQFSGRYLFSGSATDTTPVDISALSSLSSPTSADTSYYQGDDTIASVKVSSSLDVSYGVTANNPAFEKVIRSLQLVVSAPTDSTALKEAYNLLQDATTDVGNIYASLSTKASTLETQISKNTEDMNQLDSMISNVTDSDLATVTVKITELETQLEAAYSISSKLMQLKLSDYLN